MTYKEEIFHGLVHKKNSTADVLTKILIFILLVIISFTNNTYRLKISAALVTCPESKIFVLIFLMLCQGVN